MVDQIPQYPLKFDGNLALLKLIQQLVRKRRKRPRESRPIVCLIRPQGRSLLLGGLSERLTHSESRRIPHALVELDPPAVLEPEGSDSKLPTTGADTVEQVSDILRSAANKLSAGIANTRVKKFRRLELVRFLMKQQLADGDPRERQNDVRERLRRRDSDGGVQLIREIDKPLWKLAAVLGPRLWLWTRISGRAPLTGDQYRWLLRQRHLPRDNDTFAEFAVKLTDGEWQVAPPEQVIQLLLSAFIADVRDRYEASPVRLTKRRLASRCVLLLNNISRLNGGYALLNGLNELRNSGEIDPLLVITGSTRVPPYAESVSQRAKLVSEADRAYDDWRANVDHAKRARKPIAWYLPLVVPPVDKSDGWPEVRTLQYPLPPWYAARAWRLGLVVALLAGLAGGYDVVSQQHCGGGLSLTGLFAGVSRVDGECIGVTDGTYPIFAPRDDSIDFVLDRVTKQNGMAEQAHERNPRRPYATIVLLGALSLPSTDADDLTAEREGLEGAVVAQRELLIPSPADDDPIIRILVANAGHSMLHGPEVAKKISELAADDPSVTAVVGLSESRKPTERTIESLADAGFPVVASTLSDDSYAQNHLTYLQITPQNKRVAAVVAAKIDDMTKRGKVGPNGKKIKRRVRLFVTDDPTDTYSSNLYGDLRGSLTSMGIPVDGVSFTPNGGMPPDSPPGEHHSNSSREAARTYACNYDGLAVYVGRPIPDFGSLLQPLSNCPDKPALLADDDTTKYVASSELRGRYPQVPYWYISFASPAADAQNSGFYAKLKGEFPFERGNNKRARTLDGHAALAHDATMVIATAIQRLQNDRERVPITPGATWREISDIYDAGSAGGGINGASGRIDYGGSVRQHFPLNKPVLILKVTNGQAGGQVAYCGGAPSTDTRTEPWCPPPERPR